MLIRFAPAAAALVLAGAPAFAQNTPAPAPAKPAAPAAEKLAIGSPAPALSIEKWLKGTPVTGFEKGQVYVVEFWATWCGPCIASMPHLTELQKQFRQKGVTMVSITSEDPNNTLSKAEEMVKNKGDTMGYTVAWDKGRATNDSYMKAAERNGIPCSFVVDQKGSIAYIGHPMWLDEVLGKVVAGTWDAKSGSEEIEKAEGTLDELFKTAESDPKATLKGLEELEGRFHGLSGVMETTKLSLLFVAGETDKGYALARTIIDRAGKERDARMLNFVAHVIVDPDSKIQKPDLDLALKAATAADEIEGGKRSAILDTIARIHFLKGDAAKAVEIQTKAVALAPDYAKSDSEAALKEYQEAAKKK